MIFFYNYYFFIFINILVKLLKTNPMIKETKKINLKTENFEKIPKIKSIIINIYIYIYVWYY